MHRTQIYLDQESRELALWQARLQGTTLSSVARQAIKAHVKQKNIKKLNNRDFLKKIDEFHKKYPTPPGTPTDLGLEHDHYLYGTPKKYSK